MLRFLLFAVLLIQGAPGFSQGNLSVQRNFIVPVIKERSYTSLIKVAVTPGEDGNASFLKQVVLEIGAATRLEMLDSVKVYCNTDSNYLTAEKAPHAELFGVAAVTRAKRRSILINGNFRMAKGTHYIWVGLSLKPSAIVGDKIGLRVSSVLINNKKLKAASSRFGMFRIAGALRQMMQDNVHTSRIPGLATAKNGDLLAIYDARYQSKRDLQGDIDIGLSRSTDKGNSWLPMQRVLDMGEWGGLPQKFNGVSDPCILVDEKTGTVFIAGLWMHGVLDEKGRWIEGLKDSSTNWNHQWRARGSQPGFGVKQTAQFLLIKSTDNGKTWSDPVNLTKMCKKETWWLWAPAPGRGFTMNDGTLVFPTQGRDAAGKAFSTITYSKDGGNTWVTGNPASGSSTTECAAVQLSDGAVMLNMRTNANKGITGAGNGRAVAVTQDLGNTWTTHKTSRNALPEPVCMASLYKHTYQTKKGDKKSMLLFVNPNSKTKRNHITLKVSDDDGNSWPPEKFIELDEFSGSGYSCITSADNETIGIVYEGSQAQLVFEKINIREITK
ncbi:sialidase family protein [Niabella beijingensis]|uniref:sialidase family protein n=1 Tax=Niabella beijingensis TaxID=2872700 RepID=UPI001CBBCF23|nr:sialidase family protein [Niabella beijingensis]MBZ4192459.1 exo-alpha-sialidase [Niabella beijingensis]